MSEREFDPGQEATFTPMIEPDRPQIPEGQGGLSRADREPINDEPIELTEQEYLETFGSRSLDPNAEQMQQFMAAKGIPYETTVKIKVGERTINISTRRDEHNDFGIIILK